MWIFGFSPEVCPTGLCNLVFSLDCLVSNRRQALLGGIRLGGSAISFALVSARSDSIDSPLYSRKCQSATSSA